MMAGQTKQGGEAANGVRKSVKVQAPPELAWKVFTEKLGLWWPLGTHKIGKAKAIDAVIEPRVGGRWYELGEDGSTCAWGRVLVWEPHSRLVLTWDITADWTQDETLLTEVEVRFTPEGNGGTLVDLEHRHLDRYGARREDMLGIFGSESGWGGILASFARAARVSEGHR